MIRRYPDLVKDMVGLPLAGGPEINIIFKTFNASKPRIFELPKEANEVGLDFGLRCMEAILVHWKFFKLRLKSRAVPFS